MAVEDGSIENLLKNGGFTEQERRMARALVKHGRVRVAARVVGVCRQRGYALRSQIARRIGELNPDRGEVVWGSYVQERDVQVVAPPVRRRMTGTGRAPVGFSPLALAVAN